MKKISLSLLLGAIIATSAVAAKTPLQNYLGVNQIKIEGSRAYTNLENKYNSFDLKDQIQTTIADHTKILNLPKGAQFSYKLVDLIHKVSKDEMGIYQHKIILTNKVKYRDTYGKKVEKMDTKIKTLSTMSSELKEDMLVQMIKSNVKNQINNLTIAYAKL